MARSRQTQFEDVDEPSSSTRMPQSRMPRAYGRRKKLETPYVFVQDQETDPWPWVPVASTRISQMRYDPGNDQVHVIFSKNGVGWVYENVPIGVYQAFADSPSKGRFITTVLDQYPYRKATPMETSRW